MNLIRDHYGSLSVPWIQPQNPNQLHRPGMADGAVQQGNTWGIHGEYMGNMLLPKAIFEAKTWKQTTLSLALSPRNAHRG